MSIRAMVKAFSLASSTASSPVSTAATRCPSSSSSKRKVSRASELSSTRRISCTLSTLPIARGRQQPIAAAALPHIEDVAETVADEVDGQHRGREKHAGEQDDPEGQLHVGAPLRHDVAPGGDDGRRAGAEEGEIGLDEDGGSADVGALHEQGGD